MILQIMSWTDHYQKEKIKNVIGLMKDKLGEKIMRKFFGLRAKTYSYLIEGSSEEEKKKDKKVCHKKKT